MRGRRMRMGWAAVLSLVPGLGQVYAGAWGLGVVLLAANLALTAAFSLFTTRVAPTPFGLKVAVALMLADLVLTFIVAADAVWRVRRAVTGEGRRRWFRSTWVAVGVYGLASLVAGPDVAWRPFSIPSASMLPSLQIGDQIVVATDVPPGSVARGDVIVFRQPGPGPEVDFIKRVVAVPGDRVAVQGGVPVLNGAPVSQATDGPMRADDGGIEVRGRRDTEVLPGGRPHALFVTEGTPRDFPDTAVPPDTFFVLGDNRGNSMDSRYPSVGFVPFRNLVGRAGSIYWAREKARILTAVD